MGKFGGELLDQGKLPMTSKLDLLFFKALI